jgi:Flp pilus assembly protein TadG
MINFIQKIRADERGATVIEFAFVAPIFLLFLVATFDLAHREYATSILQGAVQKAARGSTLEGGAAATTSLDAQVRLAIEPLASGANYAFSRKTYNSFTRAGQAENFTDSNGNGVRNAGECFQDENGNGTWDADAGATGPGGSDDIVQYTATVTYPRLFPMAGMLGWPTDQVISATTVLRNQPYGIKNASTVTVICT